MTENHVSLAPAALLGRRRPSRLQRMLAVALGLRLGVFGLVIVVLFSILAVGAPLVVPFPPEKADFALLMASPGSAGHFLGTDALGRDILSRLIYGGRISLLVGIVAVGIAIGIGVPIGLIAGFFGGLLDDV